MIERQERQAEVADARQQAVQGRLVDDRSDQHRRAIVVTPNRESIEPIRPAVVEVPAHVNAIEIGRGRTVSCYRLVGAHRSFTAHRMPPVSDGEAGDTRVARSSFRSIGRRQGWGETPKCCSGVLF